MCNVHGINNLNPAYPHHTDCYDDGTLYDPDSDGPILNVVRPPCPYCKPAEFRKWAMDAADEHGEDQAERKAIRAAIEPIIALAARQNGAATSPEC